MLVLIPFLRNLDNILPIAFSLYIYIYKFMLLFSYIYIFTKLSARAGYDTRSIFN